VELVKNWMKWIYNIKTVNNKPFFKSRLLDISNVCIPGLPVEVSGYQLMSDG